MTYKEEGVNREGLLVGKIITVIDDDMGQQGSAANLSPTFRTFTQAGCSLRVYTDRLGALDGWEEIEKSDLIILDLNIPHGGPNGARDKFPGLTVLKELREKGVKTPAILWSARPGARELFIEMRSLGVEEIIPKPVLPSELRRVAEDVLAGREKGS